MKEVQVVVKWGGELTVGGLQRAETLGQTLREQLYGEDPAGLLRLHSSFRHDFKPPGRYMGIGAIPGAWLHRFILRFSFFSSFTSKSRKSRIKRKPAKRGKTLEKTRSNPPFHLFIHLGFLPAAALVGPGP